MRRSRSTVRIRCPFLFDHDPDGIEDTCGAWLTVTIDPPEKRTWNYPGSPASIAGVEGCEHAEELSGEAIWDAIGTQLNRAEEHDD